MQALYDEVVSASSLAFAQPLDVNKLAGARESLVAQWLVDFEDKVRAAAAKGWTHLDLAVFDGSLMHEDVSVVLLVRGPRTRADREALRASGVLTAREVLAEKLTPFQVRHVWKRGTSQNRVVVSWRTA